MGRCQLLGDLQALVVRVELVLQGETIPAVTTPLRRRALVSLKQEIVGASLNSSFV